MTNFSLACVVAGAWTIASAAGLAQPVATYWNFENPANPTQASFGPAVMTPRNDTATVLQIGTASSFGLPLLPGVGGLGLQESGVLFVPTLSPSRSLLVDANAQPNGVHANVNEISNYTLIYDILIPASAPWRSLYNTNTANANDGEAFINSANGIGISAQYDGQLIPGRWHRVAIVVGAADNEGQMQKYIDGRWVAGQGTTGSAISRRWTIVNNPVGVADFALFGDDNNETAPLYVSSIAFVPRRMLADEVAALGGPSAGGIAVPGAAPVIPTGTLRRTLVCGHRGDSAAAPENTIAAAKQAFEMGADLIEIDIRLTSDGKAVLMHDGTLDRTTDLTGNTVSTPLSTIQGSDAGLWFDDRFAGEPAPSLRELFDVAKNYTTLIYLDIKVDLMGPAIQQAMAESGIDRRQVLLWAPTRTRLTNLFNTVPGGRMVSGERPTTPAAFQALRDLGVDGLEFSWGSNVVTSAYVSQVQSEGMYIGTFTLLDPTRIAAAANTNVDFIETDFPKQMFDLLVQAPPCGQTPPVSSPFFRLGGPHPARIVQQPVSVTSCLPGSVTMTVSGTGTGPLSYQWYRNDVALLDGPQGDGSVVSGSKSVRLTITGSTPQTAGKYTAAVSNHCQTQFSTPAFTTFLTADIGIEGGAEGRDGRYDNNDFIVYINWFFGNDARADIGSEGGAAGGDGRFDNNDFIVFIDNFFNPCTP